MLFKLIGKAIGLALVSGGALAGNWIGNELRGEQTPLVQQGQANGRPGPTINVVLTNFVPALLVGLLAGRPRTLWAFAGGLLSSALIGSRYEQQMLDQLRSAGG